MIDAGIFTIERITYWPLEVKVTGSHIARGLRPSQKINRCPVALALEDHGLTMADIKLSGAVRELVFSFMEQFDKGQEVFPLTFIAEAA